MKKFFFFAPLLFLVIFWIKPGNVADIDPYNYTSQKRVLVENGAISSAHPLSSEVGLSILKKGGNAIDAAIATQLALAVVYPSAGNIGGGGFTVIHLANGKNTALDYREKAPGTASRNMYLNENGEVVKNSNREGGLAVGVPGTIAGIFLAHEQYGSLPMAELIQPAIDLASKGFAITESEAKRLNNHKKIFMKYNKHKNAFVKDTPWKTGDTLVQTDLAKTLELIRDHGEKGFYEGETARKLVEKVTKSGGIISLNDLKDYKAVERKPIEFDYKGKRVVSMPPSSSGGILVQQMLGMIERYPLDDYGFGTVKSVHLMAEVERRAFADRSKYLGDPDFVKIPYEKMVDRNYLNERMKDFDPDRATPSEDIEPGNLWKEGNETTHFSVVDKMGNAVATTYTLNSLYGSKVIVDGAGFFLNNEMDDFSAKPGAPNKNGLVGAEANAIVPNKRMLSSMTPTIVLDNNQPYLVLGSPGSATIITSVFQTIVDIMDFGMSTSDAVNAPKFHHQWKPDQIEIEKDFPDSLITKLKEMGYRFKKKASIGRTEVIKVVDGKIEAVADKRGDDSAAGF